MHDTESAYNHTIYHDALLRVGLFQCRPCDDLFRDDSRAMGHYLVFPRTSVYITPDGGEPLVADPTVVIFYNQHQTYRRAKLSEQGDACAYFEFAPSVLCDVLPHYDPAVVDRPGYPFPLNRGPSDPHSYLLQRLVVAHILNEPAPDELFIQETMILVLERILNRAFPQPRRGMAQQEMQPLGQPAHAALARDVQSLLATRFQESLTLPEIAAELYASPYHLCRVFRRQTGTTINRHRNNLRLRVALEHVLGGETDLSRLALKLGFANHSHFTRAFRLLFHTTPSDLRNSRSLSEMSKNLTV